MYKGKIKIRLRSDLCTGSGYSFAGTIDQDVCYDAVGLPFIPGKRLKGCFRETAVTALHALYDCDCINRIFGEAGSPERGKFRIGNAYIPDYSLVRADLEASFTGNSDILHAQAVLEQYSSVIGQTRLTAEGSADPGSLRYTRVIHHYDPLSDQGDEQVFEADFSADLEKEDMDALKNMILATRHIGLKRNRGMGNISVSVSYAKTSDLKPLPPVSGSDKRIRVEILVRNLEPLMLSGEMEDTTETFISGRSLQGVLAACCLRHPGCSPDTDLFKDLFLNGTVICSNLYPSVAGRSFYPVPEYVNKLKVTKKIVNILDSDGMEKHRKSKEDLLNPGFGNQPKKLKGLYAAEDINGKMLLLEPRKEMVYHHSHHKLDSRGQEGILYGMEVLTEGQEFCGMIELPEKYKAVVIRLLEDADLSFGKSRTAQYGKCRFVKTPSDAPAHNGSVEVKKGQNIVVTCLSDMALLDTDTGGFTVYEDKVRAILSESISQAVSPGGESVFQTDIPENWVSFLKTGRITGYNTSWNLRMQPVPCVKAGSAVVLKCSRACRLPKEIFLGERKAEGFGRVRLELLDQMTYEMKSENGLSSNPVRNMKADKLVRKIRRDHWVREKKNALANNRIDRKLSASGISRLTMMLKESLSETGDYREQYRLFIERIHSIKSKELREAGRALAGNFGTFSEEGDNIKFCWLENDSSVSISDREFYCKTWGECLMAVLVLWKYEKAGDRA